MELYSLLEEVDVAAISLVDEDVVVLPCEDPPWRRDAGMVNAERLTSEVFLVISGCCAVPFHVRWIWMLTEGTDYTVCVGFCVSR